MARLLINNIDLDFFNDVNVQLINSFKKVQELEGVFAEFTQEFTVPASNKNNLLFKQYFDIDILIPDDETSPQYINPHKAIDAFMILEEGREINGVVELKGVTYKKGEPASYIISFYGGLINIKSQLLDVNMTNENPALWSGFDFTFTYANIKDSWVNFGPVIMPVIANETDYFYLSEEQPYQGEYNPANIAADWDFINNEYFPNNGGGVRWSNLKPAYRLNDVVTTIIESLQYNPRKGLFYRLEWDAKIEEYLTDMYFAPSVAAGGSISTLVGHGVLFQANHITTFWDVIPPATWERWRYNNEEYDEDGNFDIPTGEFTCPVTGPLTFTTDIDFRNTTLFTFITFQLRLQRQRGVGIETMETRKVPMSIGAGATENDFYTWTVNTAEAGDIYWMEIQIVTGSTFTISKNIWTLQEAPPILENNTVQISDYMPDITAYDFLRGFLRTFNLVAIIKETHIIQIIDIESYYDQGLANLKKWTDYIDIEDISSRKVNVPKDYILNFTEGEDRANVQILSEEGRPFAEIKLEPDVDFGSDRYEQTSIFTVFPTTYMNRQNNDGSQPTESTSIPLHAQFTNDSSEVNSDFLLFYMNGVQVSDGWWLEDDPIAKTFTGENIFPFISSHKVIPGSTDYSVWKNSVYYYETLHSGGTPIRTIFNEFFSSYLQRLYDKNTRKLLFKGNLPIGEFINFQMSDRVEVDGKQYIVLEIKYNLLDETITMECMTYDDQYKREQLVGIRTDGVATISVTKGDVVLSPVFNTVSNSFLRSLGLKKKGGQFRATRVLGQGNDITVQRVSPGSYREPVISGSYEGGAMTRTLAATFTGISDWDYARSPAILAEGQFTSNDEDPALITTITIHQLDNGLVDRETELDQIQVGMQLITVGILSGLNNIYEVTGVRKTLPLYEFDVILVSTQEVYVPVNVYSIGYKGFSTDQVTVAAGKGVISDNTTDPQNPLFTDVSWDETTLTVLFPVDTGANLIYTDETGVVQQALGGNTREERRGRIIFGIVYYSIIPPSITPEVIFLQDLNYTISQQGSMLLDYINFRSIGTRKDGLFIRKIPFDLNIWTTAGEVFIPFIEWSTNRKDPNILPLPQVGDSATRAEFKVILQDGTIPATPYLEIPKQWDDGTSTPQPLTGARAVIHYIYISPAGEVWLQLGQTEYLSYTDALDSAFLDASEQIQADLVKLMIPLGQVVLNNAAADFEDPDRATIINFLQISQTIGAV